VTHAPFLAPAYGAIDCPYPLQLNFDADQSDLADPSSLCVVPCPNPQYSMAEYNGTSSFGSVLTSFCPPAKTKKKLNRRMGDDLCYFIHLFVHWIIHGYYLLTIARQKALPCEHCPVFSYLHRRYRCVLRMASILGRCR